MSKIVDAKNFIKENEGKIFISLMNKGGLIPENEMHIPEAHKPYEVENDEVFRYFFIEVTDDMSKYQDWESFSFVELLPKSMIKQGKDGFYITNTLAPFTKHKMSSLTTLTQLKKKSISTEEELWL